MKNFFENWLKIFFLISLLIIVFLGITVIDLNENINLLEINLNEKEKELIDSKNEVNELNQTINELNFFLNELRNEKLFLEKELNELIEEYESLGEEYLDLRKETINLLERIDLYRVEIQQAIEWYKFNSVLDDSFEQRKVKKELDTECIKVSLDSCEIKLSCFYLVNSEKLGLTYISDEELHGKQDKIASISEFLKNKGGDCEDYSLFFKAQYNYFLNKCKGKKIVLESWKIPEKKEDSEKHFVNYQQTWFIEGVKEIKITDYIYPNIICGNLYDFVFDRISGHCMLAFTEKKIKTVNDLIYLNNAFIIEPQNGSFQGNVNQENSKVILLNEENSSDSLESFIHSVITDEDFYLFSWNENKWQSFSLFKEELNQKQIQLNELLNQ